MTDDSGGFQGERRTFTHKHWQQAQQRIQSVHQNPNIQQQQAPHWSTPPALDLVDPLLSSHDWEGQPRTASSLGGSPARPNLDRASTSTINASPFAPLDHPRSDWRPSGILPAPSRPPGWRMEPRAHEASSPSPTPPTGSGSHTPAGLPPFDLASLGRNLPQDVFQQQEEAERRGEEGPMPARFSFDPWAPLPGTATHPRPPTSASPGANMAGLAYHDTHAATNGSDYALAPFQEPVHLPWSSAPSIEHRPTPTPPPTLHQQRIGSAPPSAVGDNSPFPSHPRSDFSHVHQQLRHQPQPQQQHQQQQQHHRQYNQQSHPQQQQRHSSTQSTGGSSFYGSQAPPSTYSSTPSGLWSSNQSGYRGTSRSSGWSAQDQPNQAENQAGTAQWGPTSQGRYSPFPSPSAGLKNMQYRSYAAYTHSAAPIGTPPVSSQYTQQAPFSAAPTADPVHSAVQAYSSPPGWPTAAPQLAPVPVQPPPITPLPPRSQPTTQVKARSRPSPAAAVTLPSGLPLNPARSPWAMWAGNVPADTSDDEIWAFFRSHPGPPGSADGAGIESIHMIARSNCAFVNYLTEAHLHHAIAVISGQPLRPRDKKCKPLLCRIRQREDDAKSGVGAQRMTGIHRAFVKEKEKGKAARPPLRTGVGLTDRSEVSSEAVAGESGTDEGGSQGSSSGQSSDSSLFQMHFPKRYFILKSHNVDDLDDSVRQGWWSTQSHNEYVLDQAYRTASEGVFIFFSANKSGQWYGYARMAGPIIPPGKEKSNSSSSEDPSGLLPRDLLADSPPRNHALAGTSEEPVDPPDAAGANPAAQGRPFRVQWLKTQRLPFARTKHVANGFNSGREVKISRDGTEVEPGSGAQMVALFESLKAPKPVVARPTGPRKTSSGSTIATTVSSAGGSAPGTPAVV